MRKVVLFIIAVALALTYCKSIDQVKTDDTPASIEVIDATGVLLLKTSFSQHSEKLAIENSMWVSWADGKVGSAENRKAATDKITP